MTPFLSNVQIYTDLSYMRKNKENYWGFLKYSLSLHTKTLGYGVMVTLQILVLTFQVRILVAQRS